MDKTNIVNKYCRKLIDKRTRLQNEMGRYNLNYRIKRILHELKFYNFIKIKLKEQKHKFTRS